MGEVAEDDTAQCTGAVPLEWVVWGVVTPLCAQCGKKTGVTKEFSYGIHPTRQESRGFISLLEEEVVRKIAMELGSVLAHPCVACEGKWFVVPVHCLNPRGPLKTSEEMADCLNAASERLLFRRRFVVWNQIKIVLDKGDGMPGVYTVDMINREWRIVCGDSPIPGVYSSRDVAQRALEEMLKARFRGEDVKALAGPDD